MPYINNLEPMEEKVFPVPSIMAYIPRRDCFATEALYALIKMDEFEAVRGDKEKFRDLVLLRVESSYKVLVDKVNAAFAFTEIIP